MKLNKKQSEALWGYVFVAPQLIGIFVFAIIPIIAVFFISMTEWNIISPPSFVGFRNYISQFNNPNFRVAIVNTLKYSLVYIPFNIIIALLIAVSIRNFKGKVFFRLFYFMPVITGSIAVSMVWLWLYDPRFGIFNMVLDFMNLPTQRFLLDQGQVIYWIGLTAVWYNMGYNLIIYIAGLEAIPNTYYEAAVIDGAGPFDKFFRVTLPMLSPTLFFTIIMTSIASFRVFDLVFIMTQGGPAKASYVYVQHIYEYGFRFFRMGESSAAAVLFFLALLVFTIIQFKGSRKWVNYDN